MRFRDAVLTAAVLCGCAARPNAPAPHVPPGIVVPHDARPGAMYRGLQIGRRGDGGVWVGEASTITLATPHRGSQLVLVLYEPDDRHRALAVAFGSGNAERWCCLRKGVRGAAFVIPFRERGRSTLTFHLRVGAPHDPRHGAVLVRAFVY